MSKRWVVSVAQSPVYYVHLSGCWVPCLDIYMLWRWLCLLRNGGEGAWKHHQCCSHSGCRSDGRLFLETVKAFFTRTPTCFPGRAARRGWLVPISIHSWESPPGFSFSQHPFFLHWCLVSPAVAAWCPLSLPSYPLFFCPGQHLSPKTDVMGSARVEKSDGAFATRQM